MKVCYNLTRDVMARLKINVYQELNNIKETNEFLAIKMDDVIKYIDLENNKMIVDMKNNIITRENSDYLFVLDFNKNNIDITLKHSKKCFSKLIEVLLIKKMKKSYLVRYSLIDDDIINEYFVKF